MKKKSSGNNGSDNGGNKNIRSPHDMPKYFTDENGKRKEYTSKERISMLEKDKYFSSLGSNPEYLKLFLKNFETKIEKRHRNKNNPYFVKNE